MLFKQHVHQQYLLILKQNKMTQNLWNRVNKPYNRQQIFNKLKSFHPNDLGDQSKMRIWIEFAKEFSQMDLACKDVEEMPFQVFDNLRRIMSVSLNKLSQETSQQNEEICKLQKEEETLKSDLKNLQKIQRENHAKENDLTEQYNNLTAKQQNLSLRIEDQSSIMDKSNDQ